MLGCCESCKSCNRNSENKESGVINQEVQSRLLLEYIYSEYTIFTLYINKLYIIIYIKLIYYATKFRGLGFGLIRTEKDVEQWFSKCGFRISSNRSITDNLLEMHILGPVSRIPQSDTPRELLPTISV